MTAKRQLCPICDAMLDWNGSSTYGVCYGGDTGSADHYYDTASYGSGFYRWSLGEYSFGLAYHGDGKTVSVWMTHDHEHAFDLLIPADSFHFDPKDRAPILAKIMVLRSFQ